MVEILYSFSPETMLNNALQYISLVLSTAIRGQVCGGHHRLYILQSMYCSESMSKLVFLPLSSKEALVVAIL